MSAIPALSIWGLQKSLVAGAAGCRLRAAILRGVSICVAPGETVAVVAACPLSLTTLLRCAAGLLRPDAGQVRWFGRFPAYAESHLIPAYIDARRLAPFRDAVPSSRLLIVDGPLDGAYDEALSALVRFARRDGIAMLAAACDGMASAALFHRQVVLKGGVLASPVATFRPPAVGRVAERRRTDSVG